MRKSAEAGDHIEMAPSLADRVPVERPQALRRRERDRLDHGHRALQPLQVVRALRVRERQLEEGLLPRPGQGVVVAVPQPLLGDPQGIGSAA